MKFLPYLLKHLRRNWLRTLSTVLAMALCIFLFCVLETVIKAVNFGLQSASASRLVTRHAVSLVFNVPLSYKERIAGLEGVKRVSTSSWFGGSLAAKKEEQGGSSGSDSSSAAGPDFSTPSRTVSATARACETCRGMTCFTARGITSRPSRACPRW